MSFALRARASYQKHVVRALDVQHDRFGVSFVLRVTKGDFKSVVQAIAWPVQKFSTSSNKYPASAELIFLIILRRLTFPIRCIDLVDMFHKHPFHLNEILMNALYCFSHPRIYLLSGPMHAGFVAEKATKYPDAIRRKSPVLEHCIGFFNSIVLCVAQPRRSADQNQAYNCHKRKHSLKFQTITSPDGFILLEDGPSREGGLTGLCTYVAASSNSWTQCS